MWRHVIQHHIFYKSHDVTSHNIMSHLQFSCDVTSYSIISHLSFSCDVTSYNIMSHLVTSSFTVIWRHVIQLHVLWRHKKVTLAVTMFCQDFLISWWLSSFNSSSKWTLNPNLGLNFEYQSWRCSCWPQNHGVLKWKERISDHVYLQKYIKRLLA